MLEQNAVVHVAVLVVVRVVVLVVALVVVLSFELVVAQIGATVEGSGKKNILLGDTSSLCLSPLSLLPSLPAPRSSPLSVP